MGDYKKALKKYYEEKKKKIEKEKLEKLKKGELKPEDEKGGNDHVHIGPNEVIEVLIEESKMEIADMLTEEEVDRQMGNLLKQLETIQLPLQKYLEAQGKTEDQLKSDFKESSEKNIKAEFALSHLIKEEGIEVEDSEIDEMITAAGDPAVAEQMQDPMQKLYIKTILQKNKLLTKLIEDTQGPHDNSEKNENGEPKKEGKNE
jgi:trigger factor